MKQNSFTDYMQTVISRLEKEQRMGTAHVYRYALNNVLSFTRGCPLDFRELTPAWLSTFQGYLDGRKLSWNTISTCFRMLRAVYFRAVDEGLVTSCNPRLFKGVHTGVDSTVKRAVSEECIRQLASEPVEDPKAEEARLLFLLLFMLRGIPFVDIAFLHPNALSGDLLTYHRRKTGTRITVRVEPMAMQLIEQLRDLRPEAPYLFPLIREPGADEYRQYQNALRHINYRLRRLGATLPGSPRLSTYSARHSWASIANFRHYDKELISNAMGHSSVLVTETYFKDYEDDKINEMNRDIVQSVCGEKVVISNPLLCR